MDAPSSLATYINIYNYSVGRLNSARAVSCQANILQCERNEFSPANWRMADYGDRTKKGAVPVFTEQPLFYWFVSPLAFFLLFLGFLRILG